ncbi:MAG: hypothetical protein PHU33_08330 [Bacteroidales bacterium]|nr:hypothetical protein [Bacteroidales bacterium]
MISGKWEVAGGCFGRRASSLAMTVRRRNKGGGGGAASPPHLPPFKQRDARHCEAEGRSNLLPRAGTHPSA